MPRRRLLALLLVLLAGLGFVLAARRCAGGRADVPRTILLITVDTLRRDHVGSFTEGRGDARTLTPRIDALARAGVRFLDARTPVPLTLPAHVSMLSGLPPAETGVRLNSYGRLPEAGARGFPLLAERLRAAGWRTGAFVSAQPLEARYGLDQGFERYDDGAEALATPGGGIVPERPGPETCARALAFLRGLGPDERAFVWVHLFEPHAPYLRYADDVAAADAAVGGLLDGVQAAGRAAGLAVLLTSDHGEMLGDLGERTHGHLLGDHVLAVPFVLLAPGRAPGLRRDPVALMDVGPTLASLAGVAGLEPVGPFAGRDLLAGEQPAARVRVAESLYGHHLYRWAQLVAASGPTGTLVDAGGTRLAWLAPAPPGEPQGAARPVSDPPAALGEAIAAYRAGERRERLGTGGADSPYGGAGQVMPFLSDADNGRLPDPYREIVTVPAMHQLKALLLGALAQGASPRALAEAREQLESLTERDPQNPELAWLVGLEREAAARVAAVAGREDDAGAMRTEAEQALLRAWNLGRRDPLGLARLVDVTATNERAGEPADGALQRALERLRALAAEVGPDCHLDVLEARLCQALAERLEAVAAASGDPAEAAQARARAADARTQAERACQRAQATCRTPAERARVTKTCR